MGSAERDPRTPAERRIERSVEDPEWPGRQISRRALKTRRSVESYLRAGVLPRYMSRLREIERGTENHARRLGQAYDALREECGEDEGLFAERWRARAEAWSFADVNELIDQHNEWYPIESGLPVDPRTRDYVRVRGRSYRREPLGPGWILERFPPSAGAAAS